MVDADRAEAAGQRAEQGLADLVGCAGRPPRQGVDELLLHQGVVAAHQHERQLVVDDVHQGLDLAVGGHAVAGGQVLDRPTPGVSNGWARPGPSPSAAGQARGGLLHVGGVAAGAVHDDVLAGRRSGT